MAAPTSSVAVLRRLQAAEPRLRIIQFRRNFGQTAAFTAGFDHARGAVIVTLDADGQNDPADIPRLLGAAGGGRLRHGQRLAAGPQGALPDPQGALDGRQLAHRQHQRRASPRPGLLAEGDAPRIWREQIHLYGELHRFMPEMASLVGARITEVPVKRSPAQGRYARSTARSRARRA